jgi:putative glutamine amidotransferase
MKKPLIAISLDHESDHKYSQFPYYALRENYITSVSKYGGTPILLPFDNQAINHYINIIDGLILTGGNFDISPSLYGDSNTHKEVTLKKNRTLFERSILLAAIEKNIPILGICGGMQLINVALGGSLIQHIPDYIDQALEHETKPYDQTSHIINIEPNTKLSLFAMHKDSEKVNSSHHQAVAKLGKNLIISATANDGVIEAIEHRNHSYMIGVQWHPEYQLSNLDNNLFKEFIKISNK